MTVDFVASRPYYLEHMAPVWEALPEEQRGQFFVPKGMQDWMKTILLASKLNLPFHLTSPERGPVKIGGEGPLVAAGYIDTTWGREVSDRQMVLMEHGAGQSYEDAWHPGMRPGRGVEDVTALQLLPGEAARKPKDCASTVVGSPQVERLRNKWPISRKSAVVAISFHWDCFAVPESYSAWPYFYSGLLPLARKFKVIGHGHPRILERLAPLYEKLDIEVVWEWEDVLARAEVFACDNSSTLFEFAALGRPVVVLDAPWFRKNVNHGLRFWDQAGVGIRCDSPERLCDAVEIAFEDKPGWADRRKEVVGQVYDLRPGAAERAATAILGLKVE